MFFGGLVNYFWVGSMWDYLVSVFCLWVVYFELFYEVMGVGCVWKLVFRWYLWLFWCENCYVFCLVGFLYVGYGIFSCFWVCFVYIYRDWLDKLGCFLCGFCFF